MKFDRPKCKPAGATCLLVQLGDDMGLELNFMVLGLDRLLREGRHSYLVDTVACYNSLLIEYDADEISLSELDKGGVGSRRRHRILGLPGDRQPPRLSPHTVLGPVDEKLSGRVFPTV